MSSKSTSLVQIRSLGCVLGQPELGLRMLLLPLPSELPIELPIDVPISVFNPLFFSNRIRY